MAYGFPENQRGQQPYGFQAANAYDSLGGAPPMQAAPGASGDAQPQQSEDEIRQNENYQKLMGMAASAQAGQGHGSSGTGASLLSQWLRSQNSQYSAPGYSDPGSGIPDMGGAY